MSHPIADKTATLLIVEPQQARRSMLVEGFKKQGFARVAQVANLKDAIGFIEGEDTPPDWIITSLFDDDKVNLFHLLVSLLGDERRRDARVSLIYDAEQGYCLQRAFSLGLYSAHGRFPDTASQMAAITDVYAVGEESGWDDCLVAAHYLRGYLKDENRFEDVERLEKRLLALYPNQALLVLRLAEALFFGGKLRQAQMVIDRMQGLEGGLEAQVAVLADQVQAALGDAEHKSVAQALRLTKCLVVDPDEAARNHVADALKEMGVETVDAFADGEAAWTAMQAKGGQPDLIVTEWRLPKLGADLLVQRVRMNGMESVPIIVFSSLVKNKDRMLLREMGVTDVIQKPMPVNRLAAAIVGIMREERRPKTVQALERRIRSLLTQRDVAGARKLLAEIPAGGKESDRTRAVLAAEIAFQGGDLKQATDLATHALFTGGEDVSVLNLLGKIHLKAGQHAQAIKFFDQAQKLSPQNVGRLLSLAEAQLGAEQQEGAEDALAKAKTIDAGNSRVVEAEAKVALAAGDTKRATGVMQRVGSTPGIVAFVNNRAVSLVTQSRVKESIDLYLTALQALPKDAKGVRPTINYNLALALLRVGDVAGAQRVLHATKTGDDKALAAKIKSLAVRTDRAVQTGEKVQLNLDHAAPPAGATAQAPAKGPAVLAAPPVDAAPGGLRCYLVYEDESADPRVEKLVPKEGAGYKAQKTLHKGGDAKVKRTG